MTCGCTNDEMGETYSDIESKIDNKILSLESMKSLSIDNIVCLYRQGYRLEHNESSSTKDILSLALAYPDIRDYMAYYDGTNTYALILWANTAGYGWVNLTVYDGPTFCGDSNECWDTRTNLKYLTRIGPLVGIGNLSDILGLQAWKCSGDNYQTCFPTPDCVPPGPVKVRDIPSGLYILGQNTIDANPPVLTITPGNSQLTISWPPVTNTQIFAYYVSITDVTGGNILIDSGYLESKSTTNTVVFGNLTNGHQHLIYVRAINTNYRNGSLASGTGTPQAPILNTITIAPATASVDMGKAQQFTATCQDQFGGTMMCPTLTWQSSNTSAATINSSGLLTGISSGTTNVTATSGSVTSNTATVTINLTCVTISDVTADKTTITTNNPVTLTATVNATANPKGPFTMQFIDQNNNVLTSCNTTATNGTCSATWTPTVAGSYNIKAKVGSCISSSAKTVTVQAPTLTTISVDPPSKTLSPGNTQQFSAICKDQSTNTMACPTMTWSVLNTSIGTISNTGIFTAGSVAGNTTVKATSGSVYGTASVTVTTTAPVLTTIIVSPSAAFVVPGSSKIFTATPKDQFGGVMTGITVTWSITDSTKGTLNTTTGLSTTFTATSEGITTIKAMSGSIFGTASVTVITTPPVAEAGFGTIGMILIGGLAIGAIFLATKKKKPQTTLTTIKK